MDEKQKARMTIVDEEETRLLIDKKNKITKNMNIFQQLKIIA
jgi:hypothetical protein